VNTATGIGLVAGALTTVAVIPQLIKTWRTRHARDLSIWQQLILITGMACWLWYGLLVNDLPLIMANMVSLFCYLLLLGMKICFDRADKMRNHDY
jgi:MtN3 and saliva related transmembrane protein